MEDWRRRRMTSGIGETGGGKREKAEDIQRCRSGENGVLDIIIIIIIDN